MDQNNSQKTISNSKEESIAKAILLLQNEKSNNDALIRPDISVPKTILLIAFLIFIIILVPVSCLFLGVYFNVPLYFLYPVALVLFALLAVLLSKKIIKKSVLLYQKLAPEKLRKSCLFVPSCSEYMLLSIDKYGVCIGCAKGVNRLCRCHHPNGGEDYP